MVGMQGYCRLLWKGLRQERQGCPGQFNFAHHLAVDLLGNLYVAEIKNWRVQKFRPRQP